MGLRGKKRVYGLVLCAGLLLLWLLCLPRDLFKGTVYSTVVESAEGELLGARVADDGQWRFPPCDTVPERFATALIQFEDRRFYRHPGVDPLAICRAIMDNIKAGHTVSGGSTITMQVIRLSRGRERTLWQKLTEAFAATRLEARCSKRHILALYASHAPFGGNVVGLEAAAWRYFGVPAGQLSWGESATLAVLPNAPSSLHPGKGREELKAKRDRLLGRLQEHGDIDHDTYQASIEEPLPEAPLPLPQWAGHYVEHCPHGKRSVTSIRLPLQKALEAVCNRRSDDMAREGIADMAAVVIDNHSGQIIAYVGNSSTYRVREGRDVDIAASARSSGSILKPMLYAAALEEGIILPKTLLPDVPVNMGGFSPQNFDRQFYGAVPADEALARSLNVPAVFLLRQYGVPKFHSLLQESGLTTLVYEPSHYGLSLVLGGAEARLDQVTAAYSAMAAAAAHRLALWYTMEALKEVNRPDQLDWRLIRSVRKAAWKTGTSYGFRDAWAVGMTPQYTIGVWAGNADGKGVPGLTGATAAGPVMFDILNLLPENDSWFQQPVSDVWAAVCTDSGMLAGPECPRTEMLIPMAGLQTEPCHYHEGGEFVLPPAMEWFYKQYHPEYSGAKKPQGKVMEFIYPQPGSTITLPRQMSGQVEGAVFRVAHHNPHQRIWWHLDGSYVGETTGIHQLRLAPGKGKHTLTVVDDEGNTVSVQFTVS